MAFVTCSQQQEKATSIFNPYLDIRDSSAIDAGTVGQKHL